LKCKKAGRDFASMKGELRAQGIRLVQWTGAFTDALQRLLQSGANQADTARTWQGPARLRELYYAVFKGAAGAFAWQAFGAGNAIARSFAHLSSHLYAPIAIDDLASHAGMSSALTTPR
jgi:hypothetical protein